MQFQNWDQQHHPEFDFYTGQEEEEEEYDGQDLMENFAHEDEFGTQLIVNNRGEEIDQEFFQQMVMEEQQQDGPSQFDFMEDLSQNPGAVSAGSRPSRQRSSRSRKSSFKGSRASRASRFERNSLKPNSDLGMCIEPDIIQNEEIQENPSLNQQYILYENQQQQQPKVINKQKQVHSKTFTMPQKLKKNFFDDGYHSESVNISVEEGKTFATNYKEPKAIKKELTPAKSPKSVQNKMAALLGQNKTNPNIIDFSNMEPTDDFSKVLNNQDSMYLDVKRLKSPKDLTKKKPQQKREKKQESIYDKIKRMGAQRYGPKSINYIRYTDLANKFIIGGPELRMSIDQLMKSDAKTFGLVVQDFTHLENITLWSELLSQSLIERRFSMVKVPDRIKEEFERTKFSQNTQDNFTFFMGVKQHLIDSEKLQILTIIGMKLDKRSYRYLRDGIKTSTSLKSIAIQNCNLAKSKFLQIVTEGMMVSKSLENIDVQMNNLDDKHVSAFTKIINAQYEQKDVLRWELGLRNPKELNVAKLGVKVFNFSKNNFGDTFALKLSMALKGDQYIKSIDLKHNKITMIGMKYFGEAIIHHPGLFSVDFRNNPCFREREYKKFAKLLQQVYFDNIATGIQDSQKYDSRIKIDWIFPICLGLEHNKLDDKDMKITHVERKEYFVQLINEISLKTKIKWNDVQQAFFGSHIEQIQMLKKQLENVKKIQAERPPSRSRSKSKSKARSLSPPQIQIKQGKQSGKTPAKTPSKTPSKTPAKTPEKAFSSIIKSTPKKTSIFKTQGTNQDHKNSTISQETGATTNKRQKSFSKTHGGTTRVQTNHSISTHLSETQQINEKYLVQLYNLEKERIESHQQSLQMAEQLLVLSKENKTLKQKLIEGQASTESQSVSSRQLNNMLDNVRSLITTIQSQKNK